MKCHDHPHVERAQLVDHSLLNHHLLYFDSLYFLAVATLGVTQVLLSQCCLMWPGVAGASEMGF